MPAASPSGARPTRRSSLSELKSRRQRRIQYRDLLRAFERLEVLESAVARQHVAKIWTHVEVAAQQRVYQKCMHYAWSF
ncbi:hypothetical protein PF003_g1492 [Phytophthora fragariae]|nr:hypothetical protein PF003_g1492 [Phytophthora fragariae]